jgi:hypothetical protein
LRPAFKEGSRWGADPKKGGQAREAFAAQDVERIEDREWEKGMRHCDGIGTCDDPNLTEAADASDKTDRRC